MDTRNAPPSSSEVPPNGSPSQSAHPLTTGMQGGTVKSRNVTYWLGERNLGQGKVLRHPYKGWPKSATYVCPRCGQAWGRVEVSLSGWLPRSRCCPQHGPGLLYPPDPYDLFFSFPPDFLRHTLTGILKMPNPILFDSYLIVGDLP